tara:strand:- start:1063 stop:2613 length:1551 start_codon:yes stop_codon:yes gene_type:complete
MTDQFSEEGEEPAIGNNVSELSVGEISQAIKRTLEGAFGFVRVRGEVGRPNYHASGHLYFTLKDADAAMDAVAWRGTVGKLSLQLEEGMEVIATGRISSYAKSSRYQIVVESVELAGEGALLKLLEDRRKKLGAEGLFEADKKQDLPFLPEVIGVITSPTGAVIHDILNRLKERFPRHVLLWSVPVQGEGAADKIAAAIEGFNALGQGGEIPRPDLLIVARGGGSLEDLWQFNEEIVVRATANSEIPLISAVGHETDITLIDYASDRRAPTPTAAAEIAVPVRSELQSQVLEDEGRLVASMSRFIQERRNHIQGIARGLPRPSELLEGNMQALDLASERLSNLVTRELERSRAHLLKTGVRLPHPREVITKAGLELSSKGARISIALQALVRERKKSFSSLSVSERINGAMRRKISEDEKRLQTGTQLLNSLSYERVLERGFTLIRDTDGEPVMQAFQTQSGQEVAISFSDGTVSATIGEKAVAKSNPLSGKLKRRKQTKSKKCSVSSGRDQGSLF